MAGLLVGLAVVSVMLGAAMASWRTVAQREKEEELVFRGKQYARAVGLFQRRFANTYPPSIDILVEQKFLRKKFKDPMTEDGDFQPLYQGTAFQLPSGRGSQTPGVGIGGRMSAGGAVVIGAAPVQNGIQQTSTSGGSRGSTTTGRSTGGATTGRGGVGPQGGIIGVTSKSTGKSFRVIDGRSQYNEWQFIWVAPAGGGRGGPGQQGGRGGMGQPGGRGGRGDQGGFGMPGTGQGQGRGPGQGRGFGAGRGGGEGGFSGQGQGPGFGSGRAGGRGRGQSS
jgi:type II secretory pathway pseudopilin PulG